MPEDTFVTKEQVDKDQNEFEDVFNEINDKTDEEIAEDEAKRAKEAAEESGDSTKEQHTNADGQDPEPDPEPAEADPTPDTVLTGEIDQLNSRVAELESELKKEHQRTSSWDGRIKAANEKVKSLEAENQTLKEQLEAKPAADPTEEGELSDKEKMDMFRTSFPELTDVVDILEKKINKIKPAKPSEVPAKTDIEPAKADPKPAETDTTEHFKLISEKHPDIDELVKSGALTTWINKQENYIQPYLNDVCAKGTADQIINMVSEFKTKTGWKSRIEQGNKDKDKQTKLDAMKETGDNSGGPLNDKEPDKTDFAQGAKDAGL